LVAVLALLCGTQAAFGATATDIRTYFPDYDPAQPEASSITTNMSLTFTDKSGNPVKDPTIDSVVSFNTGLYIPAYVTPKIKAGDTYDITLPQDIVIKQGSTNVPLHDPTKPASAPPYGYFTVTPDPSGATGGNVHIVFTDQASTSGALSGNMFYQGLLNKANITDPGQTTIKIPSEDSLQSTIDVKPETTSGIEKSGTATRNGSATSVSPDSITWTVVINKAMRNVQNIQLKDTFPANLALAGASVTVEEVDVDLYGNLKNGTGNPRAPSDSYTVGPAPSFTVKIPGPTDKVFKITYTTPIDTTAISQTGGNYSFTNSASLTSDEFPTPWKATSTVNANFGKKLEKLAVNVTSQTIPGASPARRLVYSYALRYNYNQGSVPAAEAYIDDIYDPDTANGTNTQGGHIGFDPASVVVYNVTFDSAGNPQRGSVVSPGLYTVTQSAGKFRVKFNNNISTAYLVTYQTYAAGNAQSSGSSYSPPDPNGVVSSNYTVRNTAETGDSTPSRSSTTNVVKQEGVVKKLVAADVVNKVLTWQTDLNELRYDVENLVYTDTISAVHYIYVGPSGGPPAGAEPPVIKDVTVSPQKTLELNKDYTITFQGGADDAQVVTVAFIGAYKETTHQLRLTYDTIYDASITSGSKTAVNTGDAAWTTGGTSYHARSQASYTPTASDQNNGSKSGSYNAVTKTITWDVWLGYAGTPLKNGVFTDKITSPSATQVQTYVPMSLHIYHYSINADGSTVKGKEATPTEYARFSIEDPSTANDQTITIRFPDVAQPVDGDDGNVFMIEYQTSVEGSNVAATYTNTGHFHNDNSIDHDYPASVSVNHGGNLVEKSGAQGKDGYLYWTVTINPSQSTISNVVVHDVPAIYDKSAQTIQTDTIRVVPGAVDADGNITADTQSPLVLGTDYTYTYETNTACTKVAGSIGKPELELKLIGAYATINRPYILTFRTSLMVSSSSSGTIRPYNDVTITSDSAAPMNTDQKSYVSVTVLKAGGVLEGALTGFSITKRALGGPDDGEPMDGVTFRLFDSNGNRVGVDQVTDAAGQASFGNLVEGTYSLMEVDNGAWGASGYAIPDDLRAGSYTLKVDGSGNVAAGRNILTNAQGMVVLTKTDGLHLASGDPVFEIGIDPETGLEASLPKPGPNKLEGAEFVLRDGNGDPVPGYTDTYVTDADGTITVVGLPEGTYQFVETLAPDGYIRNSTPLRFTVGTEARKDVSSVNYQGVLRFKKVMKFESAGGQYAELDNKPLAGARFTLYNGDPTIADHDDPHYPSQTWEAVSDAEGNVVFTGLPPIVSYPGYWLQETSAPGGLVLPFPGGFFPGIAVPGNSTDPASIANPGESVVDLANMEFDDDPGDDVPAVKPFDDGLDNYLIDSVVFFHKADEDGAPLGGAEFTLYADDVIGAWPNGAPAGDPPQLTAVSNADGLVIFSGLPQGSYHILETAPAPGYLLNTEVPGYLQTVTIGDVASRQELNTAQTPFVDYQYSVTFAKQLGDAVAGDSARFFLIDADGEVVSIAEAQGGGQYILNGIPPATGTDPDKAYRLVEAAAPDGYILNSDTLASFDLPAQDIAGKPAPIDLNTLASGASPALNDQGTARFRKTDAEGNPLAGYRFLLEKVDTPLGDGPIEIGEYTSGPDGWVTADGLAPGSYRFLERKPDDTARATYLTNMDPIDFRIPAAISYGTVETRDSGDLLFTPTPNALDTDPVTFENYKGSVELLKQDDYSRVALAGAVYELYRQDRARPGDDADASAAATRLGAYTTGADGTVTVQGLTPGTYYFKEKTAPAGYSVSPAIVPFSVPLIAVEQPEPVHVVAEDKKLPVPPISPEVPDRPGEDMPGGDSGNHGSGGGASGPKTGDDADPAAWLLLCLLAAGLGAGLSVRLYRRRKQRG
jgi:uncharacterized surface anchored protein